MKHSNVMIYEYKSLFYKLFSIEPIQWIERTLFACNFITDELRNDSLCNVKGDTYENELSVRVVIAFVCILSIKYCGSLSRLLVNINNENNFKILILILCS